MVGLTYGPAGRRAAQAAGGLGAEAVSVAAAAAPRELLAAPARVRPAREVPRARARFHRQVALVYNMTHFCFLHALSRTQQDRQVEPSA